MSRTNVEFLFQVTGPIADRAFSGPPRGTDQRPAFGDHLSHVSATTLNEPAKPTRRDEADSARPDNRRSTSESANNHADRRPAESSPSETAAASTAADRVNTDKDDSHGAKQNAIAETHADESASTAGVDQDGDSDDDDAGELGDAAAVHAQTSLSQNPADLSAIEGSSEIATETDAAAAENTTVASAAEGEYSIANATPNRRATKLVTTDTLAEDALEPDSQTAQKSHTAGEGIDSTSAARVGNTAENVDTILAAADDTSHANHEAHAGKRRAAAGQNGDSRAHVEAAKAAKEPSTEEEQKAEQLPTGEQDTASEEPHRVPAGRSASRPRTDATAIASRIAASVLSNGVVTQASDGAAPVEATSDATQAAKPVAAQGDGLAVASGRLQANSAAAKGGRSGGADDMPRVDATRFVGRVAKAFQTAHERGGTLQLRLSPPELGSLRLELTVKDGVMIAALETETASARRVLLDHLPALRDRLAEQNIRVERFDVDVRRDGSGGQHDPAPQNRQHQQQNHPDPRRQPAMQPGIEETAPNGPPPIQPLSNNTGINLVA